MKQLKSLNDLKYGLISVEQLNLMYSIDESLCDTVQLFKKKSYPNTEKSKAEIESIIEIQKYAMSKPNWNEHYDFCKRIDKNLFNVISNYISKIGIDIPSDELKSFNNKFDSIIVCLKNYYNRPRPYQLAYYTEQKLNNFNTISGHSPAYPSGHSFQGWITCLSLIRKYPSKAKELMILAKKIEHSRLVLGLHYPSDNEFGKLIALEVLKKNSANRF